VNTVVKYRVQWNAENLLTSGGTITVSRETSRQKVIYPASRLISAAVIAMAVGDSHW